MDAQNESGYQFLNKLGPCDFGGATDIKWPVGDKETRELCARPSPGPAQGTLTKTGEKIASQTKEEENEPRKGETDNQSHHDAEKSPVAPGENEDRSYERLLKWWKLTNQRSLHSDLVENLNKLKEHDEFPFWDLLRRVMSDMKNEMDLRDVLVEEFSGVKRTGKRSSNFQVGLLPWRELRHDVPARHAAIDIPIAEPDQSDLSELSVKPDSENSRVVPQVMAQLAETRSRSRDTSKNLLVTLGGLPERIRISSGRLQRVLENVCDGDFGWYADSLEWPTHLLRPFKLLIIFEHEIRAYVREIEETRKKLADLSEEEYLADFDKNPSYDDEDARSFRDLSNLSLSQLTGLVNDCRCLMRFMDELLLPEHNRIAQGPNDVKFEDLWHLLRVGSLVYCRDESVPQKVWRVVKTYGGRRLYASKTRYMRDQDEYVINSFSEFKLQCFYIDYDGTRHVQVLHTFSIHRFEGRQALENLPVLPLAVAERVEGLFDRNGVLYRSRQFLEYRTTKHLYYGGRTLGRTPDGVRLRSSRLDSSTLQGAAHQDEERVESEVIVDFARACQAAPRWRPGFDPLVDDDERWLRPGRHRTDDEEEADLDEWGEGICNRNWRTDTDSRWDQWQKMHFWRIEEPKRRRYEAPTTEVQAKQGALYEPSDDEFLLLLPDRVFAFVLRTRRWACLRLSKGLEGAKGLAERKTRLEPWNDLKLPHGHKELVQSLINSHFSSDPALRTHFDLVREKGNGVIILLHGVPGVGKTSTAECVAESTGRPLLPITCGDLGLSPDVVEERLQEMFRLAHAWGCILLLDEADVFLAQRSLSDMNRNSLVSVFLRTLEYYEGVLFLTTNRVGVFDEAFRSRIHVSLYYPPLDQVQTYQIWESHAAKAMRAGIIVDKDELTSFANEIFHRQQQPEFGPVWNGRQIRNAFQSALALAGFHTKSGEPVTLEKKYFQDVFNVSNKFSSYMLRVKKGLTDADFASLGMVRRDDFGGVDNFAQKGVATFQMPGPVQQSSFGQGAQNAGPMVSYGLTAQQQQQQQQMSGSVTQGYDNTRFTTPHGQASQMGQQFQVSPLQQSPINAPGLGQNTLQPYYHSQQGQPPQLQSNGTQQSAPQMVNQGQGNMNYSAVPRTPQSLGVEQSAIPSSFGSPPQGLSQHTSSQIVSYGSGGGHNHPAFSQSAQNMAQQMPSQAGQMPQQLAVMGNMQQHSQQQPQQSFEQMGSQGNAFQTPPPASA